MLALVHPIQTTVERRPTPRKHHRSSSSTVPVVPSSSSSTTTATSSISSSSHQPFTKLPPPLDIHSYNSPDLLRLLASLLSQIAATNDSLSPTSPDSPFSPSSLSHPPIWSSLTTASRLSLSTPSSTLTFHARNIPTISLEAYLLRILKYCPTTNEVFLSLLVYFDRMSKLSSDATGRPFVIDSYNIHRLVIAGVTVASKFFSDVFYTNSRYAKVGGLPQAELNQLELQFLLLNDFRLVISHDEMQRYAEQLIIFSQSTQHLTSPLHSAPIITTLPEKTISPPVTAPPLKAAPALDHQISPAVPTHVMGAFDAYGGRVPGDNTWRGSAYSTHPFSNHRFPISSSSVSSSSLPPDSSSSSSAHNKTPPAHPHRYPPPAPHSHSLPFSHPNHHSKVDPEHEMEPETETETETETEYTTDDEPTIRPAYSSAGSSEDARSLHSVDEVERDWTHEPDPDRGGQTERSTGMNGAGQMRVDVNGADPRERERERRTRQRARRRRESSASDSDNEDDGQDEDEDANGGDLTPERTMGVEGDILSGIAHGHRGGLKSNIPGSGSGVIRHTSVRDHHMGSS